LELLPHLAGRVPFQAIDDLCDTQGGVGLNEQVDVIGHNFESVNSDVKFRCLLDQQVPKANRDVVDENRAAILRTPDQVILEAENRVCVFAVSRFHTAIIQWSDN
jgi:hypothetical protein